MMHRFVSRHIRRIPMLGTIALIATTVLWTTPDTAAAKGMPIRAAYIPVATWLPAWVAKDKGFFEKHGLEVTLTPFQNVSVLTGTVGRQFDIVPATAPDFLNAAASGLDVAAVAGETIEVSNNPTVLVMVRPDGGINSPKDLVGKRIATPSIGAVMHVSVLHWLKQNGVDPSSIVPIEVPFPNMMDQLKAKRVDAVEGLQPFVGQMLQAGYKSLGAPVLSVGDPVLFPFWIAEGKWAKVHRDVIAKWIAALEEGDKFIKSHDKEARSILSKYTGLPEPIAQKVPFPTYQFSITPQQLQVWLNVLQDQGHLKQGLDVNRLVVTANK